MRPSEYRLVCRMTADGVFALIGWMHFAWGTEGVQAECIVPAKSALGVHGWELTIPLRPGEPRITGVKAGCQRVRSTTSASVGERRGARGALFGATAASFGRATGSDRGLTATRSGSDPKRGAGQGVANGE